MFNLKLLEIQVENLHVVINILLVQLHFDRIDWILVGNIFQSSDFVFENPEFWFWVTSFVFFGQKNWNLKFKTSQKPPTRIWKIKKRFPTFRSAYHFGIWAISDLPIDQVFSVGKFTKISLKIKEVKRSLQIHLTTLIKNKKSFESWQLFWDSNSNGWSWSAIGIATIIVPTVSVIPSSWISDLRQSDWRSALFNIWNVSKTETLQQPSRSDPLQADRNRQSLLSSF